MKMVSAIQILKFAKADMVWCMIQLSANMRIA